MFIISRKSLKIKIKKRQYLGHFGTVWPKIWETGFFPEKRPCTFRDIMGQNFHAKNQENPWSSFREKLSTNQPTNQQGDFKI